MRLFYAVSLVSIALNALLIGFIWAQSGGLVITNWLGNDSAVLGSRFPPELRDAFRDVLRENKTEFSAALAQARPALREVQSRARQIPLDREALDEATITLGKHLNQIEGLLFSYFVEAVSRTPDEIRRAWPTPTFPLSRPWLGDAMDAESRSEVQ